MTARGVPIVGVGASAGGLEAFTTLLRHLDADTGLAFVFIQHLGPTHASFLREALVKTTKMPVTEAEDSMAVEANHVYVIPPNTCLGLRDGRLVLTARTEDPTTHLPIDFFFRALATERGSGAIGVVLSGTASDGTEGLRAIKETDGITFAQAPLTAKFAGMPESAALAGVVDACLPLPELAAELVRLGHHPYVAAPSDSLPDATALAKIFVIVAKAAGVNFAEYKSSTLERRIARRMALRKVDSLRAYLTLLRDAPDEVLTLYEDALIHVTSFFRDPEVFEALKTAVFPAVVKDKVDGAPLRIWVPGCASGEEVYSLAIALVEFLGESSRPVQLFGSDLSARSVETARAGIYPDSALRDVSEQRRRRYFTKVERGYKVNKSIRDRCVFVQHDLSRDPPFSKVDLVSCRNVLIYFDQPLQKRVIPTLHYALRQPGFLLVGRGESLSTFRQLFAVVDKTSRVYRRTSLPSTLHFAQRLDAARPRIGEAMAMREPGEPEVDLVKRVDRLLLGRYAPPGVVVTAKMEILQFRGQTGAYLEAAPGAPQNNVMQMARDGLAMSIRATVAAAKKTSAPARTTGVELDHGGQKRPCDILVIPLLGAAETRDAAYLILFEEPQPPQREARRTPGSAKERPAPKVLQELAATKEYLQAVIAEHGRTNDDLGSANEELISGNEELQSMNEELETAKEELQSINEELTTVNDELQSRNLEVTQINSDLINVLTAVDIPILILDLERNIRRFTPKARSILNVVPADIGRSLGDIQSNLDVPDLDAQIANVIETMVVKESEVQDRAGHWHRLRIRPYRTTDSRIDGAVLCLFDIDALKHNIKDAQLASSDSARANNTKDDFLATLSHELRTPLSSMLMRAQLLRRGGMDEAKVRRAGEAIETGVKRQVQLIDDLLDVSRIVSGKLHMNFQPVDVARIVTSSVEGLSHAIERKSMRLDVQVPSSETMRKVLGDDARLQQVVTNLVANAIKFTPERGTVSVSLAVDDETAVIRVKDTGMGIEPDFLSSVFDRFAQASSENTRAYGGLGLGLAIVRHLVELHQGTVQAESPGSGLGATFSVRLPLMKREPLPAPAALRSMPGRGHLDSARLKGLRILVMDDDRATREAITEMLGPTGAVVRVVDSSAEAIKAVQEFRPEVLVCDIAMPGEDGYAFMRKLRALGIRQLDIPALALTALAHDDDRARALAAGYQMHVAKPVDIDRLTELVLELAGKPTAHPA